MYLALALSVTYICNILHRRIISLLKIRGILNNITVELKLTFSTSKIQAFNNVYKIVCCGLSILSLYNVIQPASSQYEHIISCCQEWVKCFDMVTRP